MEPKQPISSSFFNDLSYARRWSEIESILCTVVENDAEIGWIEGRVHETRSTQKEVEILLISSLESKDSTDTRLSAPQALRIFITCPEFSRFVFAINQRIKISLKGARIIQELVSHGSGILPFSLVFSSTLAIQSVRGGVCMLDGVVIDSRQNHSYSRNCFCLEYATSKLCMDGTTSPVKTSPKSRHSQLQVDDTFDITLSNNANVFDECTSYPTLNSLIEGMMTHLMGIVEAVKPPSTTANGELCASLTLADASSYESKHGFRVTCFTSRSRLARELPNPSYGDAILIKSVKVNKWLGGIVGTVYPNKLDWIVYNPKADTITVPKHAKTEPVDTFYEDAEAKKELFRQFVAAMESGPWTNSGRGL